MQRIERLLRAIDRFQQRHVVLAFPVGVVKKFGDDDAGKHAALLSYYAFLSLFPLLLAFVTLLGYALANDAALQRRMIDTVISQSQETVEELLPRARRPRRGAPATRELNPPGGAPRAAVRRD